MPVDGKNVPIIVPDYQMKSFIAVCETYNDKLVYLSPDEVHLDKGTPVRIVGSAFDGVEGTFVKVERRRKKQVVVLVQGVAAVMIAEFTDGYLQVLE
jgi:transcription antitermination factor NusG